MRFTLRSGSLRSAAGRRYWKAQIGLLSVQRKSAACITAAFTLLLQTSPVLAVAGPADANKTVMPTGTMLLPLTPKLDTGVYAKKAAPAPAPDASSSTLVKEEIEKDDLSGGTKAATTTGGNISSPRDDDKTGADDFFTEKTRLEALADDAKIGDDTTLKGTVQIVADDTEFDQEKNTFLGTGNAVALINGQDAKLEADMLLYDQNTQMMDARGNVHIYRNGQLTTGSSFKFKVTDDQYLITSPETEINGSEVIARRAYGTKAGLAFTNGTMTMATPVYMQRNVMWGPLSYKETAGQKAQHPDAYVPSKPSFRFKARKMVYERYKEQGNLTILGGRVEIGKFSIPLGKFVTTVGKNQETKVRMPMTPMISNNLMVGGMNIGPRFNTGIGRNGVLSWAPLVQFGGKQATDTSTNKSSVGLGAQVSYTNSFLTSHLAYGSVSNLAVADFKARITKHDKYQAGINRYLDDGMFGYTRARLQSEFVDNHPLTKIPYLSSLNFRTSAGWAQDNPQLVNQSPQYAKLFGNAATSKVIKSGFRLQEQVTATSQPLFNVGDDKYGIKSFIYGGVGARAYSTGGDKMLLGQLGPVLDIHLNKARFQTGYTQTAVRGKSPFVFDQYIQGSRSVYVSGDVKLSKYITVGGTLGYNLVNKLAYQKTLTVAFGPEDFKFLLSEDMIRGTQRFGFDMIYGAPAAFKTLVIKNAPDQGQLGGIQ